MLMQIFKSMAEPITPDPSTERQGNWNWRRRVAIRLICFSASVIVLSATPIVDDAKASILITSCFTLIGTIWTTYVIGTMAERHLDGKRQNERDIANLSDKTTL